jgi:hypothetical protein
MTVQFDADRRQWLVLDRGVIVARFKTSEEAWGWVEQETGSPRPEAPPDDE